MAAMEDVKGFALNTPDWRLHEDGNLYGGAASDILLAEMFGVTEAEAKLIAMAPDLLHQVSVLKEALKKCVTRTKQELDAWSSPRRRGDYPDIREGAIRATTLIHEDISAIARTALSATDV